MRVPRHDDPFAGGQRADAIARRLDHEQLAVVQQKSLRLGQSRRECGHFASEGVEAAYSAVVGVSDRDQVAGQDGEAERVL